MILVIPIFIPHRGCPHDCLFCNQQKISGHKREAGGEVDVAAVIDEWLGRKGERRRVQVAFYGGSFTCLPPRQQEELLMPVQPYLQKGEVDTIRLSTRPDCIDHQTVRLLKRYRVGVVELGVQTLTDSVLQQANRGHTGAHCLDGFRLLKEESMEVGLQLMPGLPGETTRSFLKTVARVIELKPDFVRLYPALVVEDSGLADLYRQGAYRPLSLNKAVALSAKCCMKLEASGIDVVRMGLQPSPSLEQNLVAGPYHPAFGELVRARLWFNRIRARLGGLEDGQKLEVIISHRDMSAVSGPKKCNLKRLEQLGFGGRFALRVDKSMERRSIRYVVC